MGNPTFFFLSLISRASNGQTPRTHAEPEPGAGKRSFFGIKHAAMSIQRPSSLILGLTLSPYRKGIRL